MTEAPAPVERSGPEQSRLKDLLSDYQEWRLSKGFGPLNKCQFDKEEDAFEISFGDEMPPILVYLSDIDADFYGEHAAVVSECQIGSVDSASDLGKYLRFAASEMVLTRLSLRSDEEEPLLVVEGACPYQLVRFEYLELLLRETSAIGADLIDLAEGRISEEETSVLEPVDN